MLACLIVTFVYPVSRKHVSALKLTSRKEVSVSGLSPVGMDASVSVKPKQTDVFARLENIVVMNADSLSIHKKVLTKPISVLECGVWGPGATIYVFAVRLLFI